MTLSDSDKIFFINPEIGLVKAYIYENADMIVASSAEEIEYVIEAADTADDVDDTEQVRVYRVIKKFYNSSTELIGKQIYVTDELPSWAADTIGYQEFTSTTDPTSSLAQAYTFKITVDGTLCTGDGNGDLSITTGVNDSFATIAGLIATAVNTDFGDTVVSVEKNGTSGKIRVTSASSGATSTILIAAPTAGSSLLTLLTGVDAAVDGDDVISAIVN